MEDPDEPQLEREPQCILCDEGGSELVKVTEKGKSSLIEFSKMQKNDKVVDKIEEAESVYVHEKCRKYFNNRKRIAAEIRNMNTEVKVPKMQTRSDKMPFSWENDCLFCGLNVKEGGGRWHQVMNKETKQTLNNKCNERLTVNKDDCLALDVKQRLAGTLDIVASQAKYHHNCRTTFTVVTYSNKLGAVSNASKMTAFDKACDWLETQTEVVTVTKLCDKMKEFNDGIETYKTQYVKLLLEKKYKHFVRIASSGKGKEDVIVFEDIARYHFEEKFKNLKGKDAESEKDRMIKQIGSVIVEEVKLIEESGFYPSPQELSDEDKMEAWVPPTLLKLLETVIPNRLKRIAIGHAVASASCKDLHSPLLFGLGVQLDHAFGSKWLNNHLSRLGFSVTNTEVRNFKQALIQDHQILPELTPGSFIQWSADNVDHNSRTIDGRNTFHGMGIIASVTPSVKSYSARVGRGTFSDLRQASAGNNIPIHDYDRNASYPRSIMLKPIDILRQNIGERRDEGKIFDIKWVTNWIRQPVFPRGSNWSGYMQTAFSDLDHPTSSTIFMMPLIDLQPSNPTCILSTLLFIEDQCKQHGVMTPCVTFDQPLWAKATAIIEEQQLNMVCRLGGFHLLCSFLGSIGTLMGGSGLVDILELIFAPNVIQHIISGKAYARALRGHFLIYAALQKLIFEDMVHQNLVTAEELDSLACFRENEDGLQVQGLAKKVEDALTSWKESMSEHRTAKYWLQYMDYVDVIMSYTRAERLSIWSLHLSSVGDMLNLFAATGHIHYAKSARLYLQQMSELPIKHPDLHQQFSEFSSHAIRRSDRSWAGLWSDLVIEQVMMRSIKSSGGLTRGRGFSETTRNQWVLTAHQSAAINESMSQLTKAQHSSSDQHIDVSDARVSRDASDFKKVTEWLCHHNPFDREEKRLRSLANGKVVDDKLTCESPENVGQTIHRKIDNQSMCDVKIRRKESIVCMDSEENKVNVEKSPVSMNPTVLFTRLSALAGRCENAEQYFEFELTSEPMSLFKDGQMRKPDKASLRNIVLTQEVTSSESSRRVIDGGSLLFKVHWDTSMTYNEVLEKYVKLVRKRYGECTVVFDGYELPSVKDSEHCRRGHQKKNAEVQFTGSMNICLKREDFLLNSKNKTRLIEMLSQMLESDGQDVVHSLNDADTDIVKAALKEAQVGVTEVVADDTDVAIMLLHHWSSELNDIIFKSERSKKSWSIQKSVEALPADMKDVLLCLHAFSGCDSTSAIFGLGKATVFKKFKCDKSIRELARLIQCGIDEKNKLKEAGERMLIKLYGGRVSDTLPSLRFAKYQDMMAKGIVDPSKLPPTNNASQQHTLRVLFQCAVWRELNQTCLDPLAWGWKKDGTSFVPIKTEMDCAPSEVLNFIRCKCKTSCTSKLCSCKKHGLSCVLACSHCRGECENGQIVDFDETGEEEPLSLHCSVMC